MSWNFLLRGKKESWHFPLGIFYPNNLSIKEGGLGKAHYGKFH